VRLHSRGAAPKPSACPERPDSQHPVSHLVGIQLAGHAGMRGPLHTPHGPATLGALPACGAEPRNSDVFLVQGAVFSPWVACALDCSHSFVICPDQAQGEADRGRGWGGGGLSVLRLRLPGHAYKPSIPPEDSTAEVRPFELWPDYCAGRSNQLQGKRSTSPALWMQATAPPGRTTR
jgi:hypothetical protein